MEYIVNRNKKIYKNDYLFEIDSKRDKKEEVFKGIDVKESILKKYIENEKFSQVMARITSSQLSRFYSLLEDRNFSFTSNYILNFVNEQIERNQGENGKATREFYEFFKANFLNEEFEKLNQESKLIIDTIKRYVRYSIGQKKLNGEEGEQ